jgi:serine/threonine-protein kinase RsbW
MHVETTVTADDEGATAAVAFAIGFAEDRGLETAIRLRLALIVEELFTNLAKYGYPTGTPQGSATLGLEIEDRRVTIDVTDDGCPFDPLAAPPPDLTSAPGERPIGGLGLHLVRSIAETSRYERLANHNHLTLTIRR